MVKKETNFEDKLKRLEEIVEKLESNDIELEEAIKFFEEGVVLSKDCFKKLKEVETKIEKLVKKESLEGEKKEDYTKENFLPSEGGESKSEPEEKEETDVDDNLQGKLSI